MEKTDFQNLVRDFLVISLYFPIVNYNRKIQGNHQKTPNQHLKIKFLNEKIIFFVRIFFLAKV